MTGDPVDAQGLPRVPGAPGDKPVVDVSEFFAVDLRVGIVQAVEAFPEARKPAWRLGVDFGPRLGLRWTSAQVTNYAAQDLVGRRVIGVVNLPIRRIAGFASEFLVLGAVHPDGTVALLAPDGDVPAGSPVA